MDAELLAIYQEAYASVRKFSPAAISSAARVDRAAAAATSTAVAAQRAAEMTFAQFLGNLLLLPVMWFTQPFRAAFAVLWPWLLFTTKLGLAFFALFSLVFFLTNSPALARWLRDRGERTREIYDDAALDSPALLAAEYQLARLRRAWGNLRQHFRVDARGRATFWRAMGNQWTNLWYNETMDRVRWHRDSVLLFPGDVCRLLLRNLGKVVLVAALASWIWYARHASAVAAAEEARFVAMGGRYPSDIPAWVYEPRKTSGSNRVVRGRPEMPAPPAPVPEAQLVAALGSDQSVGRAPSGVGEREAVRVTVTETRSVSQTSDAPETATDDYWGPKKGKTKFGDEKLHWCRECEQWHCCELPY
ncbi:hypothetical protein LTR53_010415 [Teratosphaeriaceae sp. CCFEE 6253]|nr:hypothetical protein LTR53_010415 [Teratosphaeriaceae sp. CCFEE 6253]